MTTRPILNPFFHKEDINTHRFQSRSLTLGDIEVRLATCPKEIQESQALRYRVFYEELQSIPSHPDILKYKKDFDHFDDHCDHLIAVDHSRQKKIVGSYRLIQKKAALAVGGFFSEAEYDISCLYKYPHGILELGRACVDAQYRQGGLIQLLWKAIYFYIRDHNIGLMFGCASFPTLDLEQVKVALSYLHQNCLAPLDIRPRALESGGVFAKDLQSTHISSNTAFQQMPPLIKGYMRIGGAIGEGAFVDRNFGSIDVCIIFETDKIHSRYKQLYERENAKLCA